MSILIPGMKMPKNCITCPFMVSRENDDCILQSLEANAHAESWEQLREGCPLIELPPHGRLGDLDKLDYAFTALRFNEDGSLNHWDDRKNWCLHGSEIEMLLANAPTIIPAEGGDAG